jgi:DNA-binding transcriptional regulator YiaG
MAKRFLVNGIEVIAEPMANGMWAGVPVDLPAAILAVLTGKINIQDFLDPRNLTIVELDENEGCDCETEEEVEVDTPATPGQTLRQYRKSQGLSKTEMANYIGVSRRSLGRYEDAGRLASEFGL